MSMGLSLVVGPPEPTAGVPSSDVNYLRLGAKANGVTDKYAKISLQMGIYIKGSTPLYATGFNVSLLDANGNMIGVQKYVECPKNSAPNDFLGIFISMPNLARFFSFDLPQDFILMDSKFPAKLQLEAMWTRQDNFKTGSDTYTYNLTPYVNPGGPWRFPLSIGEWSYTGRGEYPTAHPAHVPGIQIFGHDIGSWGWDANGKGSNIKDGAPLDSTAPGDRRLWAKPVRAVADGVVDYVFDEQVANGQDDDHPTGIVGDWESGKQVGDRTNPVWGSAPHTSPGGNQVWVFHGDRKVLYAHLKLGSVTGEAGLSKGDVVYKGQMLGRVGYAGNISGDVHLHVHAEDDQNKVCPLPMPWSTTWVYPWADAHGQSLLDKWSYLNDEGLPSDAGLKYAADSLIVATSTYPGYPIRTVGFSENGKDANYFYTQLSIFTDGLESFLKTITDYSNTGRGEVISCSTYKERDDQPTRYGVFEAAVKEREGYSLVWANTYVSDWNERAFFGVLRKLPKGSETTYGWHANQADMDAYIGTSHKTLKLICAVTFPEPSGLGFQLTNRWVTIQEPGAYDGSYWYCGNESSFNAKFDERVALGEKLRFVTTYRVGDASLAKQTDNVRLPDPLYFCVFNKNEEGAKNFVVAEKDLDTWMDISRMRNLRDDASARQMHFIV